MSGRDFDLYEDLERELRKAAREARKAARPLDWRDAAFAVFVLVCAVLCVMGGLEAALSVGGS